MRAYRAACIILCLVSSQHSGNVSVRAPPEAPAARDDPPGTTSTATTPPPVATDAQYRPWLSDECAGAEVAERPERAVAPLRWRPCDGGAPGCSQAVLPWNDSVPFTAANVDRVGDHFRVTFHRDIKGDARKIVYDEHGVPLFAWHEPYSPGTCAGLFLRWKETHGCFVLGRGSNPSLHALVPLSGADSSPLRVWKGAGDVGEDCTPELLLTFDLAGRRYVRDLSTGASQQLHLPGGEVFSALAHNAYVLVRRWGARSSAEFLDGWLWQRPNSVTLLIDPGTELLYDFTTDGESLIWVQAASSSIYDIVPVSLWTSPFATTKEAIVPRRVRDMPKMASSMKLGLAGKGHYAMVTGRLSDQHATTSIHVYRLSDARHWKVPNPTGFRASYPLYVDGDQVWYQAQQGAVAASIVRQSLRALGAGD